MKTEPRRNPSTENSLRLPGFLEPLGERDRRLLLAFCEEVNRRAEANMLKTGKLEGSHYAAMRQLMKEMGAHVP